MLLSILLTPVSAFADWTQLKQAVDMHLDQCSNAPSTAGECALMLNVVKCVYAFEIYFEYFVVCTFRTQLSSSHSVTHVHMLFSHWLP